MENEVKIAYRRVYAKLRNHTFFSIEEINRAFFDKVREHNQTRQQQKEYCRQEKFLADEKPLLKELPQNAFEVKYYTRLTVNQNNCVYLGRDKHYYSVPYQHIGEKTEVIYTRTLVRIYVRGACVATHPRTIGFGYTTKKEHMGSAHNFYRNRSPEFYIRQAAKHSDTLAELFSVFFERSEIPETQYRRCDGLLSLRRKTDPVVFERVCRYALDNDILTYQSIKRVIDTNADTIAGEAAKALASTFRVTLIYCFEKPGVLMDENDENSVIPYLSYYDFPRLVQEGIISGGMIPKIQNAFEALQAGVSSVLITKAEALDKFTGTTIAL